MALLPLHENAALFSDPFQYFPQCFTLNWKKIKILKAHPFKKLSHIRSQWFGLNEYIKQCSWHRSIVNSLVVILNENVHAWKPAERQTWRCRFPVLNSVFHAGKTPACCYTQMPTFLFGGKSLLPPSFIPTFMAFSCRLSSLFILSLVVWQPLVYHPNSKSYFQIALLLKNHTVRFLYLHEKPFLSISWQTWGSEISAGIRIIPKLLWAMLRDFQLPPCHSWALKKTELKESMWLCGRN